MPSHRLRFAPSPTGYLHVGGARTALFNWLFVRHYGGQFLLRIEDTDRARSTEESTRAIFEGMEWLGLTWDEDVVYQGANLERHQADARRLLANGAAYRCFCTPAELDQRRKEAEARREAFKYDRRCDRLPKEEIERRVAAGMPHTIRFRVPDEESTSWNDVVHGVITFPNKDVDDFVVLRSDATPIYNLAVVSDDIAMRITLVMRGDDHISNTPKQIMLYRALGAELPQFAHLPMIHGMDGKKLSKRHGATAVGDYRHMGILPDAMLNFLALLGWSPGNDVEVMTREEMIRLFSSDGLSRKAAIFDMKKLEWMNGQHLARLSADEFSTIARGAIEAASPQLSGTGYVIEKSLIDLLQKRARSVRDLAQQAIPFLVRDLDYARVAKQLDGGTPVLAAALDALRVDADWSDASIDAAIAAAADRAGTERKQVLQTLRAALMAEPVSPGIHEVLQVLGRDRALERIEAAIRYIRSRDAASSPGVAS